MKKYRFIFAFFLAVLAGSLFAIETIEYPDATIKINDEKNTVSFSPKPYTNFRIECGYNPQNNYAFCTKFYTYTLPRDEADRSERLTEIHQGMEHLDVMTMDKRLRDAFMKTFEKKSIKPVFDSPKLTKEQTNKWLEILKNPDKVGDIFEFSKPTFPVFPAKKDPGK